jgi:hypothetical protein
MKYRDWIFDRDACFDHQEAHVRTERARAAHHRAAAVDRARQLRRTGKRACDTHGVELRWIPSDQNYQCPSWPCIYTETRSRRRIE